MEVTRLDRTEPLVRELHVLKNYTPCNLLVGSGSLVKELLGNLVEPVELIF